MNIKQIHDELQSVGVPITGYYPETVDSDPGLEINNKFVLQLATYHVPPILLDTVDEDGNINEVGSFHTVDALIKFLMEN